MEIEWKARSFVLLVLKRITWKQCKSRENRNQNEGSVDSFNQVSAPISVEKYSSTKTQVRIGEIKGDFLHRGTFFISPESSSCARALSFSFPTFSLSVSIPGRLSFFFSYQHFSFPSFVAALRTLSMSISLTPKYLKNNYAFRRM